VTDQGQVEFESHRPVLIALANRTLGSADDAEDVVSEAWFRWARALNESNVQDSRAYLRAIVVRLCIDHLKSARVRRERSVGPRAAELDRPATNDALDPLVAVERREEIARGVRILLECLNPAERAVLVLRQGFDYAYREIASLLQLGEAHCRQLHRRAQARLGRDRQRVDPLLAEQTEQTELAELTERLLAASRFGDLPGLERLLADEVSIPHPVTPSAPEEDRNVALEPTPVQARKTRAASRVNGRARRSRPRRARRAVAANP
jgi:RNA polymerase sigma factor (sigma-70 family)